MFVGGQFVTNNVALWIELALFVLFLVASIVVLLKLLRRKVPFIISVVGLSITVVAWFFGLSTLWIATLIVTCGLVTTFLVINQGDLRPYVANTLSIKSKRTEKVFDRHALYTRVFQAVENLSKSKIGAIITFERNTNLDDFMKSGTVVNAPVTPELLQTIFYPGTRLHDGAVVIRRDLIAAASVYYTPTTKPLTGKFGSRHRAAIGISEVSDSVTVVVSEETGRISLAVAGELIHVTPDSFMRVLEDYMFAENDKAE